MITDAERQAGLTLDLLGYKSEPIDVFAIARRENIHLCPTKPAADFCGRIEYHEDLQRFLLFYPDLPDALTNPRVRFSVGHELGHYYIEEHRERLINGQFHSSESGFTCAKQMEQEADNFSSGLLLPERTLKARLQQRNFLTLTGILQLARDCCSSRESAAIRYVRYAEEKCVAVVSRGSQVLYAVSSDDAERIRLLIKRGSLVPENSTAARAVATKDIVEGEITGNAWCSWTRVECLYEESVSLGYSGTVLTLLAYNKN
jgi:hypothetical protein